MVKSSDKPLMTLSNPSAEKTQQARYKGSPTAITAALVMMAMAAMQCGQRSIVSETLGLWKQLASEKPSSRTIQHLSLPFPAKYAALEHISTYRVCAGHDCPVCVYVLLLRLLEFFLVRRSRHVNFTGVKWFWKCIPAVLGWSRRIPGAQELETKLGNVTRWCLSRKQEE